LNTLVIPLTTKTLDLSRKLCDFEVAHNISEKEIKECKYLIEKGKDTLVICNEMADKMEKAEMSIKAV
jgi:hypothetical protein